MVLEMVLAEFEPENSGNVFLLSSLYASAGSWGAVVTW